MKRGLILAAWLSLVAGGSVLAATSEITVDLKLDSLDYVSGERVRGIVNVVNASADIVSVGTRGSTDRFFIEVFRAKDRSQLESISSRKFVASFTIKSCEGQKLETFLGDHYGLHTPGRYLAKPVLVHRGTRFEGQSRAFDVVPGMRIGGAQQMFRGHEGLQRQFDIVTWSRKGQEHLFLTVKDTGAGETRSWRTHDLGGLMKITKPTVSVMPGGEIIVFHRLDPDNFVRSEFWSVPDEIVFRRRELVQDPETAGTARVREMYRESGGIKAKENPWWKFW